jgi:hypothetical protein
MAPSRAPVGWAGLLVAVAVIVPTILFPPWLAVRTERRELLYRSERVKDLYRWFAGFDYLLASEKWKWKDESRLVRAASERFEVTEFRIFWPMLFGEWLLLWGGVIGIRFALRRRRRRIREATRSKGPPGSMDVVEETGVG